MTKVYKNEVKNKYSNYGIGSFDVGKTKQYCYVEAPNGNHLEVFSFENNLEGFTQCYERLESFKKQENLGGLLMGSESTGSYGDPLVAWLQNKGVKMVGINPKHVNRMKEVLDNSPLKSDKKDPRVGAMLVKAGSFYEILHPKGIAGELREGCKHRRQLLIKENRILNQLESQVVRVFPEYIKVMKGLKSLTSLHILNNYPLPEDIVELGRTKLRNIMRKTSRYQLGEERARTLIKAAEQSVGIKDCTTHISLGIKNLVSEVYLIKQQIKQTELMIEGLLAESLEAEFILSIPGVGVITAAEVIGETGGLDNYSNAHKVIKMAGLNLYEKSSGIHKGKKKITKRGRSALRRIVYLAALRLVGKKGIYKEQYDRYCKTMKKPQAVVVIAKKLLRVMFALVKNREVFDLENMKQASIK